jgi:hypothetical protein
MAWTNLNFLANSLLTALKLTQMQANFAALAAGDAGAPRIIPVGVIMDTAQQDDGTTDPVGWLFLRDGRTASRTTDADLFAAIGTAFGVGDLSTTFGLPPPGYFRRPRSPTLDPDAAARVALVAGTHTLTGSTTSGSSMITVSDTGNLCPGMSVSGSGIPANSVVRRILSATQFTLGNQLDTANVNATGTGSGITFTFSKGATGNYVGSVQADAGQGHWHEIHDTEAGTYKLFNTNGGASAGYYPTNALGAGGPAEFQAITVIGDGTHGTPRTSSETRPLNVAVNEIIKR